MKKILVLLSTAAILFSAPMIAVDQAIFDFGTVQEQDGKLTHTYKITNTGDETLKIQKVKPGCSCTVVDHPKTIAPGESGEITAALKITGRTGNQDKPITVISNAENTPLLRLSLKAYIQSPIHLGRRYLVFKAPINDKVSDSVSIISEKEDFEIIDGYYQEKANPNAPKIPIKTKLTKVGSNEGRVEYNLVISFSLETTNSQAGVLYFKTNHPKKESVELRCMVEKRSTQN